MPDESSGRALRVLLVEDDADDVELSSHLLRRLRAGLNVATAGDGREALDYLSRVRGGGVDLILLDLNMPVMDGASFLRAVKREPELRSIPVVVLSTSSSEKDVTEAYGLGASGYVVKPAGYPQFERAVRGVADFWLATVRLPLRGDA
jgi:CheY-like chemotaxis protein